MTELDILLVEDDDLLRKTMFDKLSDWGHTVQACTCLCEARDVLNKMSFDLAFLDMRLPDGNGLDFLAEQRTDGVEMSVAIMTAFADVETAVSAIKSGAYDYLPKPFEDEQVRKIVRNVCGKVELTSKVSSLTQLAMGGYDDVWQFDNMIGTEEMMKVFEKAQRIAGYSDTTVLILGETGTGKGMLAKAIHRRSRRADCPFVEINCSAIPAQLIESEIFGYEKGAFTDAKARKAGLLEIADGGTVFLDEIGDMELNLQSKLLKVLEDKEFRRLGSARLTSVNVRIIAATSRDLKKMTSEGTFRQDLYYRLSVVPITMPPLREHAKSIRPLATHYLDLFCREMACTYEGFTDEAMEAMDSYSWPGNVRELRNAVERSVILGGENGRVDLDVLGLSDASHQSDGGEEGGADGIRPMSLAECEQRLIRSVLSSVNGNKNKAAEMLKIHRTTLYKKIEEYGLK